jgi:dihydroxy-acid dehydratase
MNLLEKNIRARDIVTRKALENAARIVACTGGSTNAGLHLPAIAHEAGIVFTSRTSATSSATRPTSSTSSPAANTSPRTSTRQGGVPVVMKELRKVGLVHETA